MYKAAQAPNAARYPVRQSFKYPEMFFVNEWLQVQLKSV
jgi:hypothetical protein